MKKALFTGAVITLLCIPSVAFAKGTAGVKFEGTNNVNVGDEFTVNMVIDNVNGTEYGVVGFGGYISYDSNVLELVSTSQGNSYEVLINKNNNKIIGIDYTMENGIKERTDVLKLTFKAKDEGNTNITLANGELEDRYDSIDFDVNELNITSSKIKTIENIAIDEPKNEPIVEKIDSNEEKNETQEYVETTNIEIKEEKVVQKTTKSTKKVAKKATKKVSKKKKNILEILKSFFTNIIKM